MEEPLEIENWKRISVLGSGAFGAVSLWQSNTSKEYIAIKKCKFQTSSSLTPRQRKRWEQETEIIKSLNHKNIVSYKPVPPELEAGLLKYNPTGLPLMSMEYCTKGNLRHVLTQARNSCGLSETEVRAVLGDITSAVSYLHRVNITHRDIKPENIVLQETNERQQGVIYKLIDLGYAKELNDATVSFVGTLHYLAPEILQMKNYNYSVDYWSLGVVTFEVVCGVLPFLPYSSPVERYTYIEKKEPEHICIYQMFSGSISHSSEMFKENRISSCLKHNLELWLRHVLNCDPAKRSLKFSDNMSVFDCLANVLKKKIIKVFSVPTLEFYSYEITESTLVGMLKDWIARDTKITQEDQVLLSKPVNLEICDEKPVVDIFSENDPTVYVVKKGIFADRDTFTLPKYVKVLFEDSNATYNPRELRIIYSKSLFFLWEQNELITALAAAFNLFVNYVKSTTNKFRAQARDVCTIASQLTVRCECYANIRSGISDSEFEALEESQSSLKKFLQLTEDVRKAVEAANSLIRKVEICDQRQIKLDTFLPQISDIIKRYSVSKTVDRGAQVFTKGFENSAKGMLSSKDMQQVVNEAIKFKHKLLTDKEFVNYAKATSVALKDLICLLDWLDEFKRYLLRLSESVDLNEKEHYKSLVQSCKTKCKVDQLPNGCVSDGGTHLLIEENLAIRTQIQEFVNKTSLDLKRWRDDLNESSADLNDCDI